jgi:hypothetical protein
LTISGRAFLRLDINSKKKEQAMMKVILVGDYVGKYRISVIELVLVAVNVLLLVGLVTW